MIKEGFGESEVSFDGHDNDDGAGAQAEHSPDDAGQTGRVGLRRSGKEVFEFHLEPHAQHGQQIVRSERNE